MGKFLTVNFPYLLLAAAGLYVLKKGKTFYDAADNIAAGITRPVADALAEIQFTLNGSGYIKYPNPGFYLNPDKLGADYEVLDRTWLKAMYLTHEDHGDYIEQIFDPQLKLKPAYYPLIGQEVNASTIVTALKG
tara:strand:- start:2572 stop:2973 length:402 start_codon:yes stop_codon:yes gene_type:complete